MKFLKKFWPVLFIFLFFLFFYLTGRINDKKFYIEKVNSKIIKRNNWQVRTTEFYLENNLMIDSNRIYNFDLKIGDSITKEKRTTIFNVYRKINGKYVLFKQYNSAMPTSE